MNERQSGRGEVVRKVPRDLWEVSAQLKYNEPLEPMDPLWEDTSPGRDLGYDRMYKSLGVDASASDPKDWILRAEHSRHYGAFRGHRGSGKSTELRRIRERLHRPALFHVVFLDVLEVLDVNNLQYPDLFLALATRLFGTVKEAGVELEEVYLQPLVQWFQERVVVSQRLKEFKAGIEAGAEAKGGVPLIASMFAKLSASLMASSQEKEEVRMVLKSSFPDFARAFNVLAAHVKARLQTAGKARSLLFIIDGTDRLDRDDSRAFFFDDVHQLQQLDGLFVYGMPIALVATDGNVSLAFDHVTKVPSLKLRDKHDPRGPIPPIEEPCMRVLRNIILKRAPAPLFDPDPVVTGDWGTVDRLAEMCGGHLRDLVRLMDYAFQCATGDRFDRRSVDLAVSKLATDYKRILEPEDFGLLVEIDRAGKGHVPSSERTRKLLFNLALLEYNDFWWQSHPVVRTLPAYQEALAKAAAQRTPAP